MPSFHVTFADNVSQRQLENALSQSGLLTAQVRPATPIANGYAFDEPFIKRVWSAETGMTNCECSVPEQKDHHREWDQLTPEQQEALLVYLTDFLEQSRCEHYEARYVANSGLFAGVTLQCNEEWWRPMSTMSNHTNGCRSPGM